MESSQVFQQVEDLEAHLSIHVEAKSSAAFFGAPSYEVGKTEDVAITPPLRRGHASGSTALFNVRHKIPIMSSNGGQTRRRRSPRY